MNEAPDDESEDRDFVCMKGEETFIFIYKPSLGSMLFPHLWKMAQSDDTGFTHLQAAKVADRVRRLRDYHVAEARRKEAASRGRVNKR